TFAPDFSFTSKDGELISLENLKGKTVLLDFWGSWCGPCAMAAPGLVKLHQKFAEQPVVFISIAEHDQESQWSRFIEQKKMACIPPTSCSTAMVSSGGARSATGPIPIARSRTRSARR